MRSRIKGPAAYQLIAIICGIGVSLSGWLPAVLSAQAETVSRGAADVGEQASRAKLAQLERTLDEVRATQEQILQKFDAIMEELRIIKVRASSRGSIAN